MSCFLHSFTKSHGRKQFFSIISPYLAKLILIFTSSPSSPSPPSSPSSPSPSWRRRPYRSYLDRGREIVPCIFSWHLFCTLLHHRVELLFSSQGWSANYTQNVQNCQILHYYCFEARALFCQLGMFVSWVFGVRLVSTSLPMRTLFAVFSVSFFLFCVLCVLDQSAEHRVVFWAGLGSARLYVNCLP